MTPRTSGARRRGTSNGSNFRGPSSIRTRTARGAGFAAASSTRCWLALDRHVEQGRGDQTALIYDSPVTGTVRRYSFSNCATGLRASPAGWPHSACAKAIASSSTCRWCPKRRSRCSRARASAPCTRSCSAVSRRRNSRVRIDDATPKVILSASCGIEFSDGDSVQAAARRSDSSGAPQADRRASSSQRPQVDARHSIRRAISTGATWEAAAKPGRRGTGRCDRSALHPLYVRHDRQAERRRARQRRPRGCAELQHARGLRRRRRRRVLGCVRCRLGRWAFVHRVRAADSTAARRSCTKANRCARRTPARSGASSPQHRVKTFFVAPTAFRAIKKEDPDAQLKARYDISCLSNICSLPANGSIRRRITG